MKYLSIYFSAIILIIIIMISCNIADRYMGVNQLFLPEDEKDTDPSTSFAPSSVNGLELWLDANDATTITATGVDVDQWADKSGNANHFQQLTANYRPNVNSTGLNGKTTLAFTSASVYNKLSGVGTIDCIVSTIFIVYRPNNDSSFYFLGYSTSYRVSVSAVSTFNLAYTGTTVESVTHTNIAANGVAHILVVKIRGNGFKFVSSLDGDIESNSVNDVVKTDYLINTIGAVNNASTAVADLFNGDIAEVIIYNVLISDEDKQKVEGYLAHKWGLTANLPSDHPYKTVAP